MSVVVAGAVAVGYVTGVVGLHRLNVWRLRAAGGFNVFGRLDWDTLLEGLLPAAAPDRASGPWSPKAASVFGGGPAPLLLAGEPAEDARARRELLCALVGGADVGEAQLTSAGFSGGQVRWLKTLGHLRSDPDRALGRLEDSELASAAEVYLLEQLRLTRRTHALNLELSVFTAKRRLKQGLLRFGEHPALFFARAHASSLLGFNQAAVDDLGRAVYFSDQAPFYVKAVMDTPYIEESRPALVQQCRRALDPDRKLG